jgi:hypothetical protein
VEDADGGKHKEGRHSGGGEIKGERQRGKKISRGNRASDKVVGTKRLRRGETVRAKEGETKEERQRGDRKEIKGDDNEDREKRKKA